MKKLMLFLSGFICCLFLMFLFNISNVEAYASSLFYQFTKATYPIKVNGVEKPIEAYNYNGNTYLKIIDIDKNFNNLSVTWNNSTHSVDIVDIDPSEESDKRQSNMEEKNYIDQISDSFDEFNKNITDYKINPISALKNKDYQRAEKIDPNKIIQFNNKIYVNGVNVNIPAFISNDNYYVSLNDMTKLLRNLEVLHDYKNNLHIIEQSGLGVIEKEGEQYIECKNMLDRSGLLPFPDFSTPYIYMGYASMTHGFLNTNLNIIEKPIIDSIYINDYFYGSWYIKYEDYVKELPSLLKIMSTNELYIRNRTPNQY
nr:hypothetical protein [Sedimentibacter sp.]